MECTDCGAVLSGFMDNMASIGRIDIPRCFPCYLESPSIALEYDDVELNGSDEYSQLMREALSDTLSVKLDVLFESNPAEGVVIFTRSNDEADILRTQFIESAFGPYIEDVHRSPLTTVYSEGHERLAWNAANWKHDPHGRVNRSMPTYNLVREVPCILDAHQFLSDETRGSIAVELRDEFFERAGKEGFDSLTELRGSVKDEFPFVTETTSFVTSKIVEYYRENPGYIPTTFATDDESHSGHSTGAVVSRAELEQLYEEEIENTDTYEDEIIALLEAAEGARSSDVAEVVGCSVGHARRFKYDPSTDTALRKDWSKAAESEKLSPAKRDRIIERDGNCRRCGASKQLRVHHIVPIAFGGESESENLVTLCEPCHQDAHSGAYNPPTTVYKGPEGFEDWVAE
jgi:hypothetical protein